jgi:hypothetical protein
VTKASRLTSTESARPLALLVHRQQQSAGSSLAPVLQAADKQRFRCQRSQRENELTSVEHWSTTVFIYRLIRIVQASFLKSNWS